MEKFDNVIYSKTPVLVDFYATWCGPCKMMHPILEQLKRNMGSRLRIVKVDVDAPANRQIAYTHQIQSVPTLMLFQQGRLLWRQSGVMQAADLQQVIENNVKV